MERLHRLCRNVRIEGEINEPKNDGHGRRRNDESILIDRAEKFGSGIPGAKVVVFEQCGHVPPIEKPEECKRALLEFLVKRGAVGCRQRMAGHRFFVVPKSIYKGETCCFMSGSEDVNEY